ARLEAEPLEHVARHSRRELAVDAARVPTALDHAAMEEPTRRRHPGEHADLASAPGLAEQRDVPRVTAERLDVVAHPLEGEHDVQHPGVTRPGELRPAQVL